MLEHEVLSCNLNLPIYSGWGTSARRSLYNTKYGSRYPRDDGSCGITAVCLVVGVVVFPAGWDSPEVKRTCGTAAGRYELGECGLRWAYLLAVIGCLDAIILSALAFILATRHVRLQAEPPYPANGSLYKGEVNNGYVGDAQSVAGSRKSLNLHPVLLMPQPPHPTLQPGDADRFSEFSNRTGRSKNSGFRPDYASSVQNFQL
ncbi:hypothetical protein PR048_026917 [Dryococelus australis]|uniref:Uncharacterized protein n=1 Tax=Dryococelus australis TaxID=614101 RepID=A0ABQ9GMP9_9NEOP|nr:hypothetical protein PR048_026917 [Dryococelus australis]